MVASLYAPLLSIAVKALPYAFLFSDHDKLLLSDDGTVSSLVASAIAGPVTGQSSVDNSFQVPLVSVNNGIRNCFTIGFFR